MKNAFVHRPAASALPALVLGLTLLFPGGASAADDRIQHPEPLLLAANADGSGPVIPRAPERNRRVPRRSDEPGAAVQGQITQQPAPYASEGAIPPPYSPEAATSSPPVYAPEPAPAVPATPPSYSPEPYFPEPERAAAPRPAAPAPAPAAAAPVVPAPAPVYTPPADEPRVARPEPAPRRVRAAEPEYAEDRPRRRSYDPKLVTDPSAAPSYVVQEFEVEGETTVHQVPQWPLGVPVSPRAAQQGGVMSTYSYEQPSYPVSVPVNPDGAIPQYSTQPLAVSSPEAATPSSDLPHENYPGTVGSAWGSSEAVVYTGVPPERISSPLSPNLESPRPWPTYTRQLPPERVSTPLNMEGNKAPKALRPRR